MVRVLDVQNSYCMHAQRGMEQPSEKPSRQLLSFHQFVLCTGMETPIKTKQLLSKCTGKNQQIVQGRNNNLTSGGNDTQTPRGSLCVDFSPQLVDVVDFSMCRRTDVHWLHGLSVVKRCQHVSSSAQDNFTTCVFVVSGRISFPKTRRASVQRPPWQRR